MQALDSSISAAALFFDRRRPLIAVVHVAALPGTPRADQPVAVIAHHAAAEARLYAAAGVDGLVVENMHDVPYLCGEVGPEIVAAMTAAALAVRAEFAGPVGIQVLAGANREALAVALAAGADFVRVENFVFAHVADEGLMPTAAAGPLLRYRRQIGAERIRIFADVKKKHAAHAITADVSLAETARAAEFCGADGVIVTGPATGVAASAADVAEARTAVSVPVWIGSGVTPENLAALWPHCNGCIVGSYLKRDGVWSNPPDAERVARLVRCVEALRARDSSGSER